MKMWRLHSDSGQMSVELAVIMPVLLVAMVVAFDALVFTSQCARFDHVAAQAVLAQATSPGEGDYGLDVRAQNVKEAIEQGLADPSAQVVVSTAASRSMIVWKTCTFTCRLRVAPWPFRHADFEVIGARVPTCLEHEYSLTVEPYTPGELL